MKTLRVSIVLAAMVSTALASDPVPLFPESAFVPPVAYVVGPFDVADFDVDGLPDLFLPQPGKFAVVRTKPLIVFDPPLETPNNYTLDLYAIGDFDEDGDPDLLAPRSSVTGFLLETWPNLGTGSFGTPISALPIPLPYRMETEDLDGDGHLDAVIAAGEGNFLHLFLGTGDGSFVEGASIDVGGSPSAIAVGDVEGDGLPDLAVCVSTANVTVVLRNLGGGQFGSLQAYSGFGSRLYLADVNGDHRADLFTHGSSGDVTYRIHGSGATFGLMKSMPNTKGDSLDFGDIDADGDVDLVLGRDQEIRIAWNPGNGDFVSTPNQTAIPAKDPRVLVHDFDDDSILDLGVLSSTPLFYVMRGAGGGAFEQAKQGTASLPGTIIALRRIDADPYVDAVTLATPFGVNVLLGNGQGDFAPPIPSTLPLTYVAANSHQFGDFDSDGKTDVAIAFNGYGPLVTSGVILMRGDGFGHFSAGIALLLENTKRIVAADFNRDGRLDLVCETLGKLQLLLGNAPQGTFGFAPPVLLGSTAEIVDDFVVGDFNGDGAADFAAAAILSVSLWIGDAQGGFSTPTVAALDHPNQLAVGDVDSDGRDELFALHNASGDSVLSQLEWLSGGGMGVVQTIAGDYTALSVSDVTADGIPDLSLDGFDVFTVFPGQSAGPLEPQGSFRSLGAPTTAMDIDGDGVADMFAIDDSAPTAITLTSAPRVPGPWIVHDLGKAGSKGVPRLRGDGDLTAGSTITLHLDRARPNSATFLLLGVDTAYTPTLGGILFPVPLATVALVTDALGTIDLSTTIPAGLSTRFEFDLQAWIVDPSATAGVSASNGLGVVTP